MKLYLLNETNNMHVIAMKQIYQQIPLGAV